MTSPVSLSFFLFSFFSSNNFKCSKFFSHILWIQQMPISILKYGCLENSDLKNLGSRPEKLRPLGVSKTQTLKNSDPLGVSKTQTWKIKHIYTAWIPQADLFTVRRYSCHNMHMIIYTKIKLHLCVLQCCMVMDGWFKWILKHSGSEIG